MDPAAGLGMPPLPTPTSAAPAEPPAATEGAEGRRQHAFLTGWQQQDLSASAAEASQGELEFKGPGKPDSAGPGGGSGSKEQQDPRSGGGTTSDGAGGSRRRTVRPRKTTRRSEFVDSRAAVQDNDPDYELDEDEEADEPPDDSDEDMEAAPRRRYASTGAGSGGGSGSGGTGKGGRPMSAGRSLSGSEEEEEGRGGRKTNRRVIANRQSAQRSRMRKLQYISDLEANVAGLQNDLNEMQPQVALVQSRHASMTQQNEQLRMQVAALLQETQYKDSLNEALRGELSLLQQHAAAQGMTGVGQAGGSNGAAGSQLAGSAHGGAGFQGFQSAALGLHGAQQPPQANQQQQRQQQQQQPQQQSLLPGFGSLQGFGASAGATNGPPMAQSSDTGLLAGQGGGLGEYIDPSRALGTRPYVLYQLAGLMGSGAGGSSSAAGLHLQRPAATSGSPAL